MGRAGNLEDLITHQRSNIFAKGKSRATGGSISFGERGKSEPGMEKGSQHLASLRKRAKNAKPYHQVRGAQMCTILNTERDWNRSRSDERNHTETKMNTNFVIISPNGRVINLSIYNRLYNGGQLQLHECFRAAEEGNKCQ